MANTNQAGKQAIKATEKQRQALELRKAGATFDQIAQKLGYASATGAAKAVKAGLKKTLQQPADELRLLEIERLDAMLLSLSKQLREGNLGAIDRALRIQERRAKLLGLDMPAKIEQSGGLTIKVEYVDNDNS